MMPTRWSSLFALFLAVSALFWGALRTAETRGVVLPQLPVAGPGAIFALALAVLITALALRRRLSGKPGTKPPNPLGVARMAVLGKASSHVGAMLAGGYAGYALLLLGSLDIDARRDRAVVAAVAILAAGLLIAAGVMLERSCRVPPRKDVEASAELA